MKRSIRVLFLLILVLCGCHTVNRTFQPARELRTQARQMARPWWGEHFADEKKSFQFVIMADRNGGRRPDIFEPTVHKINDLQPEFVISVGDYIQGYTESDSLLQLQWDDFFAAIAPLQMPFFCLPGNHDISNVTMHRAWLDRFGVTYYHFIYKDVLFLCLNTEDPEAGKISDEQVRYVEKTLAKNQQVDWTMVFLHKPLWQYEDPSGYSKIEALLHARPHTVIASHEHRYQKSIRQGINHYVIATTGGSSALRGAEFGEIDHIVWVTMTSHGPRLANLGVEGIYGDDIKKHGL